MVLFQRGNFTLASGKISNFKIECDVLSNDDWETLALLISERAKPFGSVFGVPRGGEKLAACLEKYKTTGPRLLVDDVFTTGKSINKHRKKDDQIWVVFARNVPPKDINSIWIMSEKTNES